MVLDEVQGIFVPKIVDTAVTGRGPEYGACPGKGYAINGMAEALFGRDVTATFELGRYRQAVAARSTDEEILENASSGGVMTGIASYLLAQKAVDGVVVSIFEHGGRGPRAKTVIARTREALIAGQGSKYCPTATNTAVAECLRDGGRYLFIGTPCQVAALRLAEHQDARVKQAFPLTMANFCGGYRDYRDLDALISWKGLGPSQTVFFRFRGGGQPGSMLVRTADGRVAAEPYPSYGRHSQFPKQKRCMFCVDATGELADFSCGDAWIPRYTAHPRPWSITLARSQRATEIVGAMTKTGRLVSEVVGFEEIVNSQRLNLDSKKFRQRKRMRVCALVGTMMPSWDVDLPKGTGSYLQEMRTLAGKLKSSTKRAIRLA